MHRLLFALLLLALLAGAFPQTAFAGDPLCLPGPYPVNEDCLPYGSWAYFAELAQLGITLPPQPLSYTVPDLNLSLVPYYYGKVNTGRGGAQVPVFASIEDAQKGKTVLRYLEPGFDYVSYIDVQVIDGKKFYMIQPGEWMRGGDVSGGVAVSQFMGLQFTATPERKFGWVLQAKDARQSPSGEAAPNGQQFVRWDLIQVYDTREAEGLTWYMVGPDAWIDSKDTALVYPAAAPPAGVENGRWIEVNLFEQTLSVYQDNHLVYATLLSSGVPGFWTRPGLFQIREKLETTPMRGSFEADRSDYYYLEDVPWTMYFDEARALHGAYWHTKFGYEQSHGCVNLSTGDSRWIFDWAVLGDWVYVWDPSGVTPEDPSLYGSGGA
ncbi:MAG: L,D-transpeptidase [Anaerolineales bacterium]